MTELEILVDSSFMENCGTASLMGALIKKYGPEGVGRLSGKTVHLRFPPLERGPGRTAESECWIMPDFAVACLVKDVLSLRDHGAAVVVHQD